MFEHILGMVIDIWGFHLQNQSWSLERVEENNVLSESFIASPILALEYYKN